jgi:hypothetical protein
MGRNAICDGRLFPHLGREDFLRDLPAAIGHIRAWKDSIVSTDIAGPAAKANQLN